MNRKIKDHLQLIVQLLNMRKITGLPCWKKKKQERKMNKRRKFLIQKYLLIEGCNMDSQSRRYLVKIIMKKSKKVDRKLINLRHQKIKKINYDKK